MKKLIITTALFAIASASAFAQSSKVAASAPPQQQPTPAQMTPAQRTASIADRQSKSFEQMYKLNPTQTKEVYAVCLEFAQKLEASRAAGKQNTRADFDAALNERNEKMKKIMTAEQYKAYESTLSHTQPQQVQNATRNK